MTRRCKECQSDIPKDAKFCPECGTAVQTSERNVCPECDTKNAANAKFCKNCGHNFSAPPSKKAATAKQQPLSRKSLYSLTGVGLAALIVTIIYHYVGFVQPLENKQEHNHQTTQEVPHNHPEQETQSPPPPSQEEIDAVAEQLNADPENVELNTKMGNLLFDSGKFQEAIPFYQKSLAKAPNNPDVIVDLGVCFFNLQDYPAAQEKFEAALKIDKDHINALYNMGVVAVQLGDVDRLIHFWGVLRDVAPNSQQAVRATQILEQIHQNIDQFAKDKQETPSE